MCILVSLIFLLCFGYVYFKPRLDVLEDGRDILWYSWKGKRRYKIYE